MKEPSLTPFVNDARHLRLNSRELKSLLVPLAAIAEKHRRGKAAVPMGLALSTVARNWGGGKEIQRRKPLVDAESERFASLHKLAKKCESA